MGKNTAIAGTFLCFKAKKELYLCERTRLSV